MQVIFYLEGVWSWLWLLLRVWWFSKVFYVLNSHISFYCRCTRIELLNAMRWSRVSLQGLRRYNRLFGFYRLRFRRYWWSRRLFTCWFLDSWWLRRRSKYWLLSLSIKLVLWRTSLRWGYRAVSFLFLHWLWLGVRSFRGKILNNRNLFRLGGCLWLLNGFRVFELGLLNRTGQIGWSKCNLIVLSNTLIDYRFFVLFLIDDVVCVLEKGLSLNHVWTFESHHFQGLTVKLHQLLLHVGVLLWIDLLLNLVKFLLFVWLLLFIVVRGVGIFRVNDQLLKGKQHLHFLLVYFGLDNIFKQDQFVEGCSKPATVQIYSSLPLNFDDWIKNIVVCNLPIDILRWLLKLFLELHFSAVRLWDLWNHRFVQILERLLLLFVLWFEIEICLRFKFSCLIICPFFLINIFLVCLMKLASLFSSSELFDRRHHFTWSKSVRVSGEVLYGSLHRSKHLIQSGSFELSSKDLNLLHFYTSNHTTSVALDCNCCFHNRSLS